MIALENALPPRNVALDIDSGTAAEAVGKALGLLKNDTRVLDWPAFSLAVLERERSSGTSVGGGLLLPHGRGDFVKELVMSFVRLRSPVQIAGDEVRFVVAVAVPASMAAEYLRLVGALARVFRDEKSKGQLGSLKTARELVEWLGERCR